MSASFGSKTILDRSSHFFRARVVKSGGEYAQGPNSLSYSMPKRLAICAAFFILVYSFLSLTFVCWWQDGFCFAEAPTGSNYSNIEGGARIVFSRWASEAVVPVGLGLALILVPLNLSSAFLHIPILGILSVALSLASAIAFLIAAITMFAILPSIEDRAVSTWYTLPLTTRLFISQEDMVEDWKSDARALTIACIFGAVVCALSVVFLLPLVSSMLYSIRQRRRQIFSISLHNAVGRDSTEYSSLAYPSSSPRKSEKDTLLPFSLALQYAPSWWSLLTSVAPSSGIHDGKHDEPTSPILRALQNALLTCTGFLCCRSRDKKHRSTCSRLLGVCGLVDCCSCMDTPLHVFQRNVASKASYFCGSCGENAFNACFPPLMDVESAAAAAARTAREQAGAAKASGDSSSTPTESKEPDSSSDPNSRSSNNSETVVDVNKLQDGVRADGRPLLSPEVRRTRPPHLVPPRGQADESASGAALGPASPFVGRERGQEEKAYPGQDGEHRERISARLSERLSARRREEKDSALSPPRGTLASSGMSKEIELPTRRL